ncbi:G-protein coupled receptor-associated protein LMBRD2B-like [Ornithodoros turicata]
MAVGPLVAEICFTFVLAAFLLHRYGNFTQHHLLVTISVFVAWYFSFIVIFILPLDISTTAYRQCLHEVSSLTILPTHVSHNTTFDNATTTEEPFVSFTNICMWPWSYIPQGVLQSLWRVVYWTSQVLTWIILPMMQSYSTAGDFNVTGKLRTALIENAIYYGSYLLIFAGLLVYVAIQPNMHLDAGKLKVICITASNTWGLFLLVLLLGYGLVEVPRSCWNNGRRGHVLRYLYFKAAKLSIEKSEADEKLDDVLEEVQQANTSLSQHHSLRKFLDVILEKCPGEKGNEGSRPRMSREADALSGSAVTEKSLVRLHRQVIRALQQKNRTYCQWEMLVENTLYWEDVQKNEGSVDRRFRSSTTVERSIFERIVCSPVVEWYWKCILRGWVLRGLGVLLTVLSIAVVWSEMTFFIRTPIVSLFGIFHRTAEKNYNYVGIEVMSILTIAYMCVCTYYTVFKVRVLNYYYLAPHHHTDEYSLIFSGMLLCRLTPPMCLNFLGLIHLDTHVTSEANRVETAYTEIMGHMDVISIIADGFNIYFPILICVLCLATYFHLGSRVLHSLGFEQFLGDDDITTDLVEEGRDLIKHERGRRQRAAEGELRRRLQYEKQARSSARQQDMVETGGMTRSGSEESARAELLRDVEPVDYTEVRQRNDLDRLRRDPYDIDTTGRSSRPSNRWGDPPRGLFDDV